MALYRLDPLLCRREQLRLLRDLVDQAVVQGRLSGRPANHLSFGQQRMVELARKATREARFGSRLHGHRYN